MPRSSSSRLALLLIAAGAVALIVAAWLIYPPAGVAVFALEALFAGYVLLYLEAQNASTRQSDAPE